MIPINGTKHVQSDKEGAIGGKIHAALTKLASDQIPNCPHSEFDAELLASFFQNWVQSVQVEVVDSREQMTYNLDAQIGESSACATALLCGVKANFETVGLDINGKFGNCASSFKSKVESLVSWAQQEGTQKIFRLQERHS
ncbi:unnamed protein product [Nesidiocoris tenuis]|uniref:alkaline phosphatase n=1 Tax=Nesidiocoris tenuis TaxID=355587 RepID=A0A6H5HDG3_9HEMI|nr:unnamed protein product [Nesidiocoris tenuis]